MTEAEEKYILKAFKETYKYFPKGNIIHYYNKQSPDFIIENKGYKTGIEVTEVFQDLDGEKTYRKGSKLKTKESVHKKIGDAVVQEIQREFNFYFQLHLLFNDSEKLDKETIVKQCVSSARPRMRKLRDKEKIIINDYFSLPKQIQRMSILRIDKMQTSIYCPCEGGTMASLEAKHLQRIIEEKDDNLLRYSSNCNEEWLLIREGNFYAGSFSEIKLSSPITSKFDKVFLLRTGIGKPDLIQLKPIL